MSRLHGEKIYELMGEIGEDLIVEATPAALLVGTAAAAVGGAVNPADLYTVPGKASAGAAAKTGFAAWLAKGGWVALAAGAVATAGIAVGAFFLAGNGDTPPAGSDIPVGEIVSGDAEDTTLAESSEETFDETDPETESASETESETEPQVCTHTFGDWNVDTAATCTAGGVNIHTCSLCGLTETQATLPIPHTFENEICTVCGAAASKLEFTSNGDGTCSVTGWGKEFTSYGDFPLVIPTYAPTGERVVSIRAEAFNSEKIHKTPPYEIIVSEGIEVIEDNAFQGCGWLRSVTLPSTLVTIGNNAFSFTALNSVTLPEGVRSIGSAAFFQTSLTSVTIPASVTEIGNGAFAYINSLQEVTFAEGSGLTALPTNLFWKTGLTEITLPDSVTAIGETAFEDCCSLTTVHAKNLTEIGASAFAGCHSLTALPASLGLEGIGDNALKGCTALATVEYDGGYYMPMEGNPYAVLIYGKSDVTTASLHPDTKLVMGSAFEGNTALTTFTFPDTATEIPDRFFYGCTALTSVNMPAALTHVGNEAFFDCRVLPNVTLPEGVLTVGANVFVGCHGFTEIILPDSITDIGFEAFRDCMNLTAVKLPASLTFIADGLFSNCQSLIGTVVIPDGVTTIKSNPFARCTELGTVVMPKSVVRFEGQIFTVGVREIQYAGTMAEWEAIEKDKGWMGGHCYLNRIICSDGEIELD